MNNQLRHIIPLLLYSIFLTSIMAEPVFADKHKQKIYTVGFAQDTMANDWRRAQVNQLSDAFKKYPDIKLIVTDAGGKSSRQIQDMEDLANQKVDVLITSPRDGAASTPAISRIYKQGTPVVLISRSIISDDYTSLVTPDNYKIASDAATYMAKKMSGKGNILIIRGIPTATSAIDRTKGFLDTIKQYPGIKIVAIKDGNYLRSDAIRAVDEVLSSNTSFDAIYSQSDSMASGARLALIKAGISPKTKLIIGIDYIKEARTAIRTGNQTASFLYPTSAKETADIVIKMLHGNKVPKKVLVESQIITRENVDKIEPIF
jgi:ribose transport system substrate-binding protein